MSPAGPENRHTGRPDIVTLDSRIVYRNRWIRVLEDKIRRRDGSEGIYGVVEKANFVAVAAVQDGFIHLVEQYRYPVQERFWELPQGAWDHAPDTDPEILARGELREETGLEADSMVDAGELCLAYGICTHRFHVFLATNLRQGEASPEIEEQDLVTHAFPLTRVEQMICGGIIKDAVTVSALGLLKLKGLI
ncbi:MAG TPA: NUDIX hydrolase [Alphaproteobacteria bacterium]|nr:NUDIX hydrolase [Alphaproteobacteria bacterium]